MKPRLSPAKTRRRGGSFAVSESLERRQLLSAAVDNATLYFSNAKATGNPPSAQRLVTLTNTGASSINFSSAVLTGNTTGFAISSAPAANAPIVPGGTIQVGITFTAPSTTSGVTLYTSGLAINTTDASNPSLNVNLRAFALTGYQGGPEPSLGQIFDTLYQLPINVANPPSTLNTLNLPYQLNGNQTVLYGEEVVAQTFVRASAAPVTIEPLATFGPAASVPYTGADYTMGIYTPGNSASTNPVFSATTPAGSPAGGDGQTVNPISHPVAPGTVSTDGNNIVSFDPGNSPFGVYNFFPVVTPNLTAYSQDSLNNSIPINNIAHQTRRIRFWPNKTTAGVVIPNSYVGAIEEAANNDIQDVVFSINNVTIVDLPEQLVFAQPPTSTSPGAVISPTVAVAVQDSTGNTVTSDTSTVTLTLSQGTFAGGGNTVTAVASNGVATFSNLAINAAGSYTITASDGTLAPATSATFFISNPGSKLAFTAQPVNALAGAAFTSPIIVTVLDSQGNVSASDGSTVTLTLSSGTFFGGGNTTTAVASGGVATFTNLVVNSADTPGAYTLTASDGSFTSAASNTFQVGSNAKVINFDDSNAAGNATNPLIAYSSGWSVSATGNTILNHFGTTVTNSSTTNNTAALTFTGTQVTFYAGEKPNRGIAAVKIDSGTETLVDLYSNANNGNGVAVPVFTSAILSAGNHTITVRVTGTKGSGNATTVSIDRFVVSNATPSITWPTPTDIVYSTALTSTQLAASVTPAGNNGLTIPGNFTYTPASGTVLAAGQNQALNVAFVPTDSGNFTTANAAVAINVLAENTTTTVAAAAGSSNPAAPGQGVSFTATVSPTAPATATPTGTVQFLVGGTNFGTPVTLVNGSATSAADSTLPSGNSTITAIYTPDSGNQATSTSSQFNQQIQTVISSSSINAEAIQRSMVTSIALTFSQNIASLDAGAFTLTTSTGAAVNNVTITPVISGNVITLTFSGSAVTGGSLPDGRYILTATASAIHDASGLTLPADQTFSFFRFFGDSNGDGTVNGTDYRAFFKAYLQTSPSAGYNAAFDVNGDGTINGTDYRAFFKNYLQTLP